jgi:hypothetical protein
MNERKTYYLSSKREPRYDILLLNKYILKSKNKLKKLEIAKRK